MLRWLLDARNSRFGVLLVLMIVIIAVLYFFHAMLLPFILAGFLAYLLDPAVRGVQRLPLWRYRMPRGAAVLAIYAIIIALLALSGFYGVPKLMVEMTRMAHSMPKILDQFDRELLQPFSREMDRLVSTYLAAPSLAVPEPSPQAPPDSGHGGPAPGPAPANAAEPRHGKAPANGESDEPSSPTQDALRHLVEDYVYTVRHIDDNRIEIVAHKRRQASKAGDRQQLSLTQQANQFIAQLNANVEENLGQMLVQGRNVLARVSGFIFNLFLVFMLAGFILVDPERVKRFMRSMVPDQYHNAYDVWVVRLDHGLSGVVRGQVVICLLNGTLTGIGIYFLGVPFWFTLSVIATVFSLVPIFGVLISSVPILMVSITVSFYTALAAVAWILVIHFLEGNFFNPKILGDAAKIHPVLIVFSLVVGQSLAGVVGALLAVPIFSLLYNSFRFLVTQAEKMEHHA